MSTIVVCGDLVWDTNLTSWPRLGRDYGEAHSDTQMHSRRGGAWYLHDLVKLAVFEAGLKDVQIFAPREIEGWEIEKKDSLVGGIARGFSVWKWVPEKNDPKTGAWRISDFLGCQKPQWTKQIDGKVVNLSLPSIKDEPSEPDLLIIDDLKIEFASDKRFWPKALLGSEPGASRIVAKASQPFDRILWQQLLEKKWAERLTVVVSAAELRDAGVRLSRSLSWDQVIEDVQEAFSKGGPCWEFHHCRRVVVRFGRSGAAVFSRVPRSPAEFAKPPEKLQFERFVFDAHQLEEPWPEKYKGRTFGQASAMVAAFACHELFDLKGRQPSSHVTASRGLRAAECLHRIGAGQSKNNIDLTTAENVAFTSDETDMDGVRAFLVATAPTLEPLLTGTAEQKKQNTKKLEEAIKKTQQLVASSKSKSELNSFKSAYPRELLDKPLLGGSLPKRPSLLTDALGTSVEFLTVAAQEIVRAGATEVLKDVPSLTFGDYFTVDREEIECINAVRSLIVEYKNPTPNARPLSLAVFGAPGSGKSFAIKQLAKRVFEQDKAILDFNLSQFSTLADLHEAFQEVRDKSVQGQVPLVFWDEFDSKFKDQELGWLKEFLAPMQDWQFFSNGKAHPLAKCIFIFAGGTCSTFQQFDKSESSLFGQAAKEHFKNVKGPDFVSRLRGYVNIKGPNPVIVPQDEVHIEDKVFIIRRALLLRSMIERYHAEVIDPQTKRIHICPRVLTALLKVEKYIHGARSVESLISLCTPRASKYFGASELPPSEVVNLHVSRDFTTILQERDRHYLTPENIKEIAAFTHESWDAIADSLSSSARVTRSTNPVRDKGYEELSEEQKEDNMRPARLTALRLEAFGYRICAKHNSDSIGSDEIDPVVRDKLARSEHRRWMREKLLRGVAYAFGKKADAVFQEQKKSLMLHENLCLFDDLEREDTALDGAIPNGITKFLKKNKLVLVKVSSLREKEILAEADPWTTRHHVSPSRNS